MFYKSCCHNIHFLEEPDVIVLDLILNDHNSQITLRDLCCSYDRLHLWRPSTWKPWYLCRDFKIVYLCPEVLRKNRCCDVIPPYCTNLEPNHTYDGRPEINLADSFTGRRGEDISNRKLKWAYERIYRLQRKGRTKIWYKIDLENGNK